MRSTLGILVTLAIGAAASPVEQRSNRLADAVITSDAAIFLETPLTDASAFALLERVLHAAGVAFGLESAAPLTPARSYTNRPIDRTVTLNGLRLSEALDAIVKADPHFRWTEMDRVVVVRGVAEGEGLLGRVVTHYIVSKAPPRDALGSLAIALDSARNINGNATGISTMQVSRPAAGMPPAPKDLSLTRDDASVLAILNGLSQAHGALSWTVLYDTAPASYDTATVSLISPTETVTSTSPSAMRVWSAASKNLREAPASGALTLPVRGDLGNLVTMYAREAHVRVGIEQITVEPSRPIPGVLTLEVTRSGPAAAVAKIVGLDPRYEWSRDGDVFHVKPKPGVTGRFTLLDKKVENFSATKEPIMSVLARVVWLLGGQPGGTGGELGQGPVTDIRQRGEELRRTPITVSMPKGGTLRDVIDAICKAEGTLSWQLRPQSSSGDHLSLEVASFNGWGLSQSFSMPARATVAKEPARSPEPVRVSSVSLPAALDANIDRTTVPWSPLRAEGALAFSALGAAAHVPMGVESLPTPLRELPAANADPRLTTRPVVTAPLVVGPGRLSDALAIVQERVTGYDVSVVDSVISVAPASLLRAKEHFMNVPIDRFEATDVSIYRAVTRLRHMLNPNVPERDFVNYGGSFGASSPEDLRNRTAATKALLDRKVSLTVEHATPREILNKLVAQHGELMWVASYSGQTSTEAAEPVERDLTIQLAPFADVGYTFGVGPYREPRPASLPTAPPPPRPAPRPPIDPSVRRVSVQLPVTATELKNAATQLARANRVPFGVEVIEPPLTPADMASRRSNGPGSQSYDLTGLSIEAALDKLVGFNPDYAWSKDNGVYHVRPKIFTGRADVALSRHVDAFDKNAANVTEALRQITLIFDPDQPPPRPGMGPTHEPDNLRAYIEKPMSLSLRNVTVRDILDEMARQNGAMSWSIAYPDTTGVYDGIKLSWAGFDGWGITMNGRRR